MPYILQKRPDGRTAILGSAGDGPLAEDVIVPLDAGDVVRGRLVADWAVGLHTLSSKDVREFFAAGKNE